MPLHSGTFRKHYDVISHRRQSSDGLSRCVEELRFKLHKRWPVWPLLPAVNRCHRGELAVCANPRIAELSRKCSVLSYRPF